jgi:serine protease AprX
MYSSVCMGSWRLPRFVTVLASFVAAALVAMAFVSASQGGATEGVAALGTGTSPALTDVAKRHPGKNVEVIVQLRQGADVAAAHKLVTAAGGHVTRELSLINGFSASMKAGAAAKLADSALVRTVTVNAAVAKTDSQVDPSRLATAYNQSIRADDAWDHGVTGRGVGVAVIDTGTAGDLVDFSTPTTNPTSRVIASAVVNPAASSAGDGFGHGTHVAGIVAGNGTNRPAGDPLRGKYAGVAPNANLISIKAGDDDGGATVLDVIDGLQFAVDFRQDYNIKVVNLSLRSTNAESYKTDPLDAAVEAAWFKGIVVVAAAGNDGADPDAVKYAPANDPYAITVGGVDDQGTKSTSDDSLASWSSRGTTQDGFAKPDVVAPGAHIVSNLAPNSDFASLCPSCVTDGEYFKVGGTSMAAAVVSGAVADVIQARPLWTPNQIKGTLIKRSRPIYEVTSSSGASVSTDGVVGLGGATVSVSGSSSKQVGVEVALDRVLGISTPAPAANQNQTPNTYVDPATGDIDYSRASWSRASWSDAADPLRASWSRASWSRASWSRASWSATPESCSDFERASWSRASWSDADIQMAKEQCAAIQPTRASWSSTQFARASWSTSFDK